MPFTALAIGAGVGLLKSETVDKAKEDRQRKLAAETQRYSPWTGLQAQPIKEADPFGSALQYGATGAQMKSQMDLNKAQMGWLNRGGSPQYTAALDATGPSGWSGWGLHGPKAPPNWQNLDLGLGVGSF